MMVVWFVVLCSCSDIGYIVLFSGGGGGRGESGCLGGSFRGQF